MMKRHKIKLPFTTLILQNAPQKWENFFSSMFFYDADHTRNYLNIEIVVKEIVRHADEFYLEEKTVKSGDSFVVFDTKMNRAIINFHSFRQDNITLVVDPEFDLYYLFTFFIEPLMIIWNTANGILYLHASGYAENDGVIIQTAWRHTGKTKTILNKCSQGARFYGDDYCILYANKVYAYPKKVNLFSYNFAEHPKLFSFLSPLVTIRLLLTLLFKRILSVFANVLHGSVSKIFYRISQLAEVSTNISLSPQQLNFKIGTPMKINKIQLLQKTSLNHTITDGMQQNLEDKLLEIIRYELHEFFSIFTHYLYLFPENAETMIYINNFHASYAKLLKKYSKFLGAKYLQVEEASV